MTDTNTEFTEKALYDIEFIKGEQYRQKDEGQKADAFEGMSQRAAEREKEAAKISRDFEDRTSPIQRVSMNLSGIERMADRYGSEYGNISAAATKYLDNLVKNGLSPKEAAEIRSGKEPKVDIDGSKKSFFGRMKNKVKNIWKPFNPKLSMESDIAKLKIAMAHDPELMSDLQSKTSSTIHNYATNFKEVAEKRDRFSQDFHSTRVYHMRDKEKAGMLSEQAAEKSQGHEATLDAINKEREAAAQKIEVTQTARETVGITDANANTGVDKLAEKADKMKNMSPQQRLAMRMAEMRGTKKEAPKPVVKQEMSGNVLAQNLANSKTNA